MINHVISVALNSPSCLVSISSGHQANHRVVFMSSAVSMATPCERQVCESGGGECEHVPVMLRPVVFFSSVCFAPVQGMDPAARIRSSKDLMIQKADNEKVKKRIRVSHVSCVFSVQGPRVQSLCTHNKSVMPLLTQTFGCSKD